VLGLNPHAGDGGVIGREEIEIIAPALESARGSGINAFGPFPADGLFGRRGDKEFDAVLAMYHDQGLAPFKALAMGAGVNVTLGLPIVRTSPDHGTAFGIAGQGVASAESMKEAILLAEKIVAKRKSAVS
jgi:4-hydroxythreonine-4-phosphate dehydrogenase